MLNLQFAGLSQPQSLNISQRASVRLQENEIVLQQTEELYFASNDSADDDLNLDEIAYEDNGVSLSHFDLLNGIKTRVDQRLFAFMRESIGAKIQVMEIALNFGLDLKDPERQNARFNKAFSALEANGLIKRKDKPMGIYYFDPHVSLTEEGFKRVG